MQIPSSEVTYLGFKINQEGTVPLPGKMPATEDYYRVESLSWDDEILSRSLTQSIEHTRAASQFNEKGHSLEMGCQPDSVMLPNFGSG